MREHYEKTMKAHSERLERVYRAKLNEEDVTTFIHIDSENVNVKEIKSAIYAKSSDLQKLMNSMESNQNKTRSQIAFSCKKLEGIIAKEQRESLPPNLAKKSDLNKLAVTIDNNANEMQSQIIHFCDKLEAMILKKQKKVKSINHILRAHQSECHQLKLEMLNLMGDVAKWQELSRRHEHNASGNTVNQKIKCSQSPGIYCMIV